MVLVISCLVLACTGIVQLEPDPINPVDPGVNPNPNPNPDPDPDPDTDPDPDPDRIEAEDGTLTGIAIKQDRAGFSGQGYVDGFDANQDSLELAIEVRTSGLYLLSIAYAAPLGKKVCDLYANGKFVQGVSLEPSERFVETAGIRIFLKAGPNVIRIGKGWGWFEIDYLVLVLASTPPLSVENALVNPAASDKTKALMAYLVKSYGKQILSGQQDLSQADWLFAQIGKRPAVLGLDMMDYSPSRVERGTTSDAAERAIEWWKAGGIVAFCWHWNAPTGLIDQPGGREWYKGFNTNASTFDIARAMANPLSEDYKLLERDIDAIAEQLIKLRDAGVPVLWRPLHEAEGGWFWWGAKGAEACKKLYRLLYDRLTRVHKLNNLIWVWTSTDTRNAVAWYPGDQVVDVIGTDVYAPGPGSHDSLAGLFYNLVSIYGGRKLIALTENDAIPDIEAAIEQRAGWAWFCTWGGFIRDGQYNPAAFLETVYNHTYVLTMDELPP